MSPDPWMALKSKADADFRSRDLGGALESYSQAIETTAGTISSERAVLLSNRAVVYIYQKRV